MATFGKNPPPVERGGLQSGNELNEHLSLLPNAQAEQAFRFTSAQLDSICAERAARLQQWRELIDGETMELYFVVGGQTQVTSPTC
ncbi:MAG: hypothetical protein ABL888_09260 [Pirellulaceae bacterium]